MSAQSDITRIQIDQLAVGNGASIFILVSGVGQQVAVTFKSIAGGTLWICGSNSASLPVGTSGVLVSNDFKVDGPAQFYVAATGATVTAALYRELSGSSI